MEKLSACPNEKCPDFGRHDAGNITILLQESGRKRLRVSRCKTCGKSFNELRGTPFWKTKLNWNTIGGIFRCLLEGKSSGTTADQVGVFQTTVRNWWHRAGKSQENFCFVVECLRDLEVLDDDPIPLFEALHKLDVQHQSQMRGKTYLNPEITREWIEQTFPKPAPCEV